MGILAILNFVAYIVLEVNGNDAGDRLKYSQYDIGNAIAAIFVALATMWITVEDRGEHLLVAWGPCRCFLCGSGKEKIKYSDIRTYQLTKTCWFGAGLIGAVKLYVTNVSCSWSNIQIDSI